MPDCSQRTAPWRGSLRCVCWLLCAGGMLIGCAAWGQQPAGHKVPQRVVLKSVPSFDEVLSRPYTPDVPFGATGARLWASSPQGWGFKDDIHWIFLSNLCGFDLEVRDEHGLLVPRQAVYFPSHVHLEGAARALTASASFTYRSDKVEHPLVAPFRPEKRWTAWSSGRREDWYAVDFGGPRALRGVKLWFYDDTGTGGCRPPQEFHVERWENDQWLPVENPQRSPRVPRPDENTLRFDPITTARLRVVFRHAGTDHYTGLYGFEPIGVEGASSDGPPIAIEFSGDKFITPDDMLVAVLRATNRTDQPRRFTVVPAPDWVGQYEAQVISNRSPRRPEEPHGPWAFRAQASGRLQGIDVRQSLRFAVSSLPARAMDVKDRRRLTIAVARGREDNAAFLRQALGFEYTLAPGETKLVKVALEIKPTAESSALDRVLSPPESISAVLEAGTDRIGVLAPERQDTRDPLADQVRGYQAWFDANAAAFECSDPLLTKMYYHRAYVLRKNMLDPKLGALRWPTQAEGRWRSRWYPNVISYGAAHQVREARWLADPSYWQGHVRTWANNQKPNHVYPSHVTLSGPADGQYTDWITSSAWDGQLVHPDPAFLAEVADKLADNVRGWQATYDPDGDGLLFVDSHWWTGMEYQPSFFYFSEFATSDGFDQPRAPVNLDRVDLTAYNFGNAKAVSDIYKALNQIEKAEEFDALAGKIARAVAEKMWQKDRQFFYSLRTSDHAVADVKEVIGVYPFYFGMFAPGEGYEQAWASILDPAQFWTPWPVASASKECPAYSQTGWPQAGGRAVACMWNGPTWPHANSIVLTAMARTLRGDRGLAAEQASPLSKEKFWELFTSFTRAQYRDQDPSNPWTGEFYNGETGAWKTAERDYNHSTWMDILIPEVVGLVPRADEILEVDPLVPESALAHLTLDGQRYHGRDVTIVWDAPGDDVDQHGDGREGLDVYLDGMRVASAERLGRILFDMKTGEPVR